MTDIGRVKATMRKGREAEVSMGPAEKNVCSCLERRELPIVKMRKELVVTMSTVVDVGG